MNKAASGLSPAERTLQRELDERGPGGMDYLEQRRRRLIPIGDSLVAHGMARRLAAGRLVTTGALDHARRALLGRLEAQGAVQHSAGERGPSPASGELHLREIARLLSVSRGAARAVADALIEEGVLEERGPTVVAACSTARRPPGAGASGGIA